MLFTKLMQPSRFPMESFARQRWNLITEANTATLEDWRAQPSSAPAGVAAS